jgi:hypothetical protein
MRMSRLTSNPRSVVTFVAFTLVCLLSMPSVGAAQQYRYSSNNTIDPGTNIVVRTNESIDANRSDGRVYSGVVQQDVMGRNNRIVIPRGSEAELVVRRESGNDIGVDLDAININGQRYSVDAENSVEATQQKDGLGANQRTGKYVGGGAVIGAIIGAIAGGGKGAAIGAAGGAAAGAGAQVLTRGRTVSVPSESLLTFRLAQPLRAGVADRGYMYNGRHYHSGYPDSQQANNYRQKPYYNDRGTITIRSDNNVTWDGPPNSSVYVQVDSEPQKLFASGQSGTQEAPWIAPGHTYVFILKDANGNEVARSQEDLRPTRNRYRR